MAHLWWDCPIIKRYWEKILGFRKEMTKIELEVDPWTVLLHGIEGEVKLYKESLMPHLLNAAKELIPRKWQTAERPLIWEGITVVEEIYYMEHTSYCRNDHREGAKDKWECWEE